MNKYYIISFKFIRWNKTRDTGVQIVQLWNNRQYDYSFQIDHN